MARVFTPDDARPKNLPGRRSREIVGADSGAASSTVRLVEIDAAKPGEPTRGPHVHFGFEESIYILSGEGVTRTDSGEHRVKAGDTILIPANERHATSNTGKETLKLLCFFPVNEIVAGTREYPSWDEMDARKEQAND